jgi:hypothetical protein
MVASAQKVGLMAVTGADNEQITRNWEYYRGKPMGEFEYASLELDRELEACNNGLEQAITSCVTLFQSLQDDSSNANCLGDPDARERFSVWAKKSLMNLCVLTEKVNQQTNAIFDYAKITNIFGENDKPIDYEPMLEALPEKFTNEIKENVKEEIQTWKLANDISNLSLK